MTCSHRKRGHREDYSRGGMKEDVKFKKKKRPDVGGAPLTPALTTAKAAGETLSQTKQPQTAQISINYVKT